MRKTISLSLILLFVCSLSYGQDTIQRKKNEFVFSLNTPVDFTSLSLGVGYKRAVAKNKFIKINIPRFMYDETSSNGMRMLNVTTSLLVGFEFRKNLTPKLILFHGPNVGFTYLYAESKYENNSMDYNTISSTESISYTLGLQYKLCNNLYISAQSSPGYSMGVSNTHYPNNELSNTSYTNNAFRFDYGVGSISFVFPF